MSRRILVIDGDDKGHFFLAVDGGKMTIGDSPTHAEAVLKDLHIRRIHCEVEVEEDLVVVAAQAAPVNGKGTPPQGLHPGEVLHIGHSHLRLERNANDDLVRDDLPLPIDDVGGGDRSLEEELREPEVAPADSLAPAAATPLGKLIKRLTVIDGADKGRFFFLPESGSMTIGNSNRNAEIVLHDLYVARVHCSLEVAEGDVSISHIDGQDGTLVNGQRVAGRRVIQANDTIRVGNSYLRYEMVPEETLHAGNAEDFEVVEDEEAEQAHCLPHASVDELVELEGQVVGHYELGPLLGRGQSGLVFRAQDKKNHKPAAVKVLAREFPTDETELNQFIRAMKTLTQLHHPNLVSLLGVGRTKPHCWIAREYVEGESLARVLQRFGEGGKPSWKRALRLVVHVGRALDYLHRHKVIHGNITPRNLLIRTDKTVRVADLMMHAALEGSQLRAMIQEQKLLAEVPYMAPEQLGENAFVDQLADLYSLGAVAYHLAAGQTPFNAKTPEYLIARIQQAKLVRPSKHQPDLPPPFDGVLVKLLARKQEDRYQSAASLLADVEPLAEKFEVTV